MEEIENSERKNINDGSSSLITFEEFEYSQTDNATKTEENIIDNNNEISANKIVGDQANDEKTLQKFPGYTSEDDDDSGWDTDLEAEESITSSYDPNSTDRYVAACKEFGVVPASYFMRNMMNIRLHMRHHGLGVKGVKAMSIALVTNTHLTGLDFTDNSLGSEGVMHLCEMLIENCYVTEMDVSENKIGFDGVRYICDTLNQTDMLHRLSLRANDLGTKSACLIAETIQHNTGLKYLDVSHNLFGEEAGLHFGPAIALNEYLEEINLSWNHIRQKGACAISRALKENITLKKLDLSWNGFAHDGIYVLSEALKVNGSLQQLNVSSNRITSVGASHLQKGLMVNEGLTVLKIGQNPIQHGSIYLLQAMKDNINSTLNELDLADIKVNAQFMELLRVMQETAPDLRVYHAGLGGSPQKAAERPKPMKVLRDYIKNNQMRVFDFFKSLDKDKSMSISIPEFVSGLKESGVPLRHDELVALVNSLDLDGDGEIDYKELLVGHQEIKKEERDGILKDKAIKERKKRLTNVSRLSPAAEIFRKTSTGAKSPVQNPSLSNRAKSPQSRSFEDTVEEHPRSSDVFQNPGHKNLRPKSSDVLHRGVDKGSRPKSSNEHFSNTNNSVRKRATTLLPYK